PGALGSFGGAQFLDNLTNGSCARFDGKSAWGAPEAAITLPLLVGEIERDDRDIFTLDILPYVQFRPVQQRMNPDMRAFLKIRLELIPKFGRLILDVPFHVLIPRAEISFLRPGRLLVTANPHDHSREVMFLEHLLQSVLLERATAFHASST